MRKQRYKTEAQILEQYRVSLTNAVNQNQIADTLEEYGYDSKVIKKGSDLLEATFIAYNYNKLEDNETFQVRADFDNQKEQISEQYIKHRKKAKVLFRKDEVILNKLGLNVAVPRIYANWIETLKAFYNAIQSDSSLLSNLSQLKITEDDITSAITAINVLETTRSLYLKEKGESQDATKKKDKAMSEMEEWMNDFYAVAKIAMEDQPQLLESLGLVVRS